MAFTVWQVLSILLALVLIALPIYLMVLVCKALKKYISGKEVRAEKAESKKALGEVLREHRISCKMTQEFVAEHLGVSRQAVSKWESGASEPSMSNLIAAAKLYGTEAEEILKQVRKEKE